MLPNNATPPIWDYIFQATVWVIEDSHKLGGLKVQNFYPIFGLVIDRGGGMIFRVGGVCHFWPPSQKIPIFILKNATRMVQNIGEKRRNKDGG